MGSTVGQERAAAAARRVVRLPGSLGRLTVDIAPEARARRVHAQSLWSLIVLAVAMLTVLASANAQNTFTTYSYNSGLMTLQSGNATCAATTSLAGTVTIQTNVLINGAGYAPVTAFNLTAGAGQGATVFTFPGPNPYVDPPFVNVGGLNSYILNGQVIFAAIGLSYNGPPPGMTIAAGQNLRGFGIATATPAFVAIVPGAAPPENDYQIILTSPQPTFSCTYRNTQNGTWGGAAIAKNVGGPSPPPGPSSLPSSWVNPQITDRCPNQTPNCHVADPINAATGNKYQVEMDFAGAPVTGVALTRYYNSQDTTSSGFGAVWHSTWHRSLNQFSLTMVTVTRADGRQDTFTLSGGIWQADPDVTSVLTPVPATGTQTGWQLVTADDTAEIYTLTGQLASVTTRAGLTTTLTYNANSQLTTVTGPFGDRLSFSNDSTGRVTQMTVPDGGTYTYAYDSNNNLTSVTHPDSSVRRYVYGNTSFPNALTGIIDEDGHQYASWTYDTQGRAISSQHAGGADLTAVAYHADGTSSVTDADGNTHSYALVTQFSLVKPTALGGVPYPPSGGQAFTYDANGFLASRTDYDGNVTTYTHDTRGDETSRTEASGTALARTISTAWLPAFHLPTTITEPGRVTSFGYDAHGNLLQKTITAGSLTRSWSYTYNAAGQAVTATDPRGDVTRYTYDNTGDLASITDALGHVTSFTSYDADGRPLSYTDPNGLVTKFTYNFRGEVTSRNAGGEVTTYSYDPAGQLIKLTRPDGSFFTYSYDAAHRLTAIANAVGDRIAYTYDPASNLITKQIFDPSGHLTRTRSYAYDAVNRLAKAIGAQGQTTAYSYDPNSNLTAVADPLSHTTGYGHDALNRLVQGIDPKGGATDYGYDALDHLTGITDPRDLTTSYAWDGLDDQTAVTSPDSGATARTFDAAGDVATSTDARGLTTAYQYDALNRPIKATYADGRAVTWQYDQGANGIGHLTAMSDLSGQTA
jgi:YD repeat-containing protein